MVATKLVLDAKFAEGVVDGMIKALRKEYLTEFRDAFISGAILTLSDCITRPEDEISVAEVMQRVMGHLEEQVAREVVEADKAEPEDNPWIRRGQEEPQADRPAWLWVIHIYGPESIKGKLLVGEYMKAKQGVDEGWYCPSCSIPICEDWIVAWKYIPESAPYEEGK